MLIFPSSELEAIKVSSALIATPLTEPSDSDLNASILDLMFQILNVLSKLPDIRYLELFEKII